MVGIYDGHAIDCEDDVADPQARLGCGTAGRNMLDRETPSRGAENHTDLAVLVHARVLGFAGCARPHMLARRAQDKVALSED
jgi:hypothetical protein